jgi:hypothetical protein
MYSFSCVRNIKRGALSQEPNMGSISQQSDAVSITHSDGRGSSSEQEAEAALDSLGSFGSQGLSYCFLSALHELTLLPSPLSKFCCGKRFF